MVSQYSPLTAMSFLWLRNHFSIYYDYLTIASIDDLNRITNRRLQPYFGTEHPFVIGAKFPVGRSLVPDSIAPFKRPYLLFQANNIYKQLFLGPAGLVGNIFSWRLLCLSFGTYLLQFNKSRFIFFTSLYFSLLNS